MKLNADFERASGLSGIRAEADQTPGNTSFIDTGSQSEVDGHIVQHTVAISRESLTPLVPTRH